MRSARAGAPRYGRRHDRPGRRGGCSPRCICSSTRRAPDLAAHVYRATSSTPTAGSPGTTAGTRAHLPGPTACCSRRWARCSACGDRGRGWRLVGRDCCRSGESLERRRCRAAGTAPAVWFALALAATRSPGGCRSRSAAAVAAWGSSRRTGRWRTRGRARRAGDRLMQPGGRRVRRAGRCGVVAGLARPRPRGAVGAGRRRARGRPALVACSSRRRHRAVHRAGVLAGAGRRRRGASRSPARGRWRTGAVLYALLLVGACASTNAAGQATPRASVRSLAGPLASAALWPRAGARCAACSRCRWPTGSSTPPVRDCDRRLHGDAPRGAGLLRAAARRARPRSAGAPPARIEIPFTARALGEPRESPSGSRSPAAGSASSTARATASSTARTAAPRARYRAWLHDNAVRWVALPDAPLDSSARAEARLVRARPALPARGLARRRTGGSTPCATPGAAGRAGGWAPTGSTTAGGLVRVRWTPVLGGRRGAAAASAKAAGDWTLRHAASGGRAVRVGAIRLRLARALSHSPRAAARILTLPMPRVRALQARLLPHGWFDLAAAGAALLRRLQRLPARARDGRRPRRDRGGVRPRARR